MSKIEELREEIRKLECKPLIENILKKKDIMIENVGKVFSTHALSRDVILKKRDNTTTMLTLSVVKITGLKYGRTDYDLHDEELIYRLDSDNLKEVKIYYQFDSINISLNSSYDGDRIQYFQGGHSKNIHWRYEQKPELFENLKNKVKLTIDTLLETSVKLLKSPIEILGNFNELDSNSRLESLKSLGYKVVELTSTEYSYISDWHPFTYGNLGILATKDSCTLIENKIKEYQENISRARDWSCGGEYISAYKMTEIDRRIVNILTSILDKIKNEKSKEVSGN